MYICSCMKEVRTRNGIMEQTFFHVFLYIYSYLNLLKYVEVKYILLKKSFATFIVLVTFLGK